MNFLKGFSRRKLVIVFLLIFIIIVSMGKFYLNNKTNQAFLELSEKNISKILVHKTGAYIIEDYVISNEKRVKTILESLVIIEKDYVPIKDFLSWNGQYSYSLQFEDSQSPPHYSQLFIHGTDYITLRIYNYNENKFEKYRSKVKINEEKMKALLSEEE